MLVRILFAGSGGQGVLTAGNILGNACMQEDYFVTYIPSYGAAVRGGTANCTICLSDEEIASPVTSSPDIVVALNQPSAQAFVIRIEPGGQLIYNASMISSIPYRGDVNLFPVPANELAMKVGSEKSVNMVMLGAFIKLLNIIKVDSVCASIDAMMAKKKKIAELSKQAVMEGWSGFPFGNGSPQ